MLKKGITATTAALAVLALTAPAAYADKTVIDDGADATASNNDILTVTIKHQAKKLVVRSDYTDLRKVSDAGSASTAIFIDTKKNRKGPELALVSALESGTDYALVKVKNWKISDKRVNCNHSLKLKWKKDFSKLTMDRACFGQKAKVRVSQKMVDQYDASHPVIDWAPGKRSFSGWVRSSAAG
ncbi:hypothetical protein [Nocardioides alcanivorans]|uniref:hypothetical protein n=1 Tax=Nocardioides alcanivorans TaxID=2897352 RepID=UPI001F21B668|nr:hypothetical protein [Nocardioides alcanivorans]